MRRLRRDEDRRRFVARRAGLRQVLAAYLDIDPRAVVVVRSCQRCGDAEHGRPRLPGAVDLSFSTASRPGLAVVAVTEAAMSVGVDIERRRRRRHRRAAAHGAHRGRDGGRRRRLADRRRPPVVSQGSGAQGGGRRSRRAVAGLPGRARTGGRRLAPHGPGAGRRLGRGAGYRRSADGALDRARNGGISRDRRRVPRRGCAR